MTVPSTVPAVPGEAAGGAGRVPAPDLARGFMLAGHRVRARAAVPLTGYFGGIGTAAIVGLVAIPVTRRPNALATATWLVSVLIAEVMRRRGHRGPAEVLLRRLAYRA
ncbi:hypothetical protein HNP84_006368 [Thermocatellispora tengchongensis]|uniref:DUF418 domain-containing protein n=1 Tax=Thermocatellispora tengchongensis TaxID=1073253 RepID=A0A840PHL3_9ACTN|nr:hypothetical protein [Thermocatellispora tengchongensis]